ncbi:MAG: response regulator [Candidatus Rokubacteria bacterium]|nr:response regulator [Candidatus Rokubacteria bacterium]
MTRSLLSSLRARLLALVLVALLPMAGLILSSALERRRAAATEVGESVLRLTRLATANHARVLEGARQLLVGLAHLPEVRERKGEACGPLFAALLPHYPLYANLGAIDPDGELFCSALPQDRPIHLADRAYFQRAVATRAFAVGDYQIGRATGRATINLGYPALDDEGRVRAVVFAALDLSGLGRLGADASLPPGSVLTVIDGNGTILVRHPDPERWVGRSLPEAAIVKTALADRIGVAEAVDLDGVPQILGFLPLFEARDAGEIYLSIGLSREAVFSRLDRLLAKNLVGVGLVGALALGAAWVGGDLFVLRRIKALAGAARRLAAGNLSVRSGLPHGEGELGQLARAFDEMADALDRLTRRQALILDSVGEGIFGVDLEGKASFVNQATATMVGYAAEELVGQPVHVVVHHSRPDGTAHPLEDCPIHATLAGGAVARVRDEVFWRQDGTSFPVEYVSTPIRERGAIVGAVIAFTDITERRRREEEQRRLQGQLAQSEKLAAMGELLAGVAHELNNPLSVVLGQTALLREAAEGGPLAQRAEKIARAAERCARIVKNFLAMAHQHPPERHPVRLHEVVEEVLELLAYQLRMDTVEVRLDLADGLPVLWADPHQLGQVVVNLITNAQQAMRGTPPPRRLTLTTRHEPARGRITLEVADSGPGIPPEIQARIFEPFFTTKPPGQGTGVGLALCQGIIAAHGGSIGVESRPGQGATFRIDLPVVAPPRARPEAPPADRLPAPRGQAILVVDDEPEVADVLAEMLAADGHQVEVADDGASALDSLQTRSYDLILSDLRMPQLDGPGLYRELARRRPDLLPRVVFLTGDTLSPEITAFLNETGAPCLD